MSANPTTVAAEILAPPTLELIWQEDASAYAFTRTPEGELSAANLSLGRPAVAEIALLGRELAVRRVEVAELIRLAAAPTTGFPLGESARATFAIVELAHRSLREGLVHPSLVHEDGSWSAFWGATLDGHVQAALSAIAAAMPPACAGAFDGDAQATVLDLYPVVVDQLARDRLREARVRLTTPTPYGRRSALDLFLDGLTAPEAGLPPHSGYAALERQLTRWVGGGLDQRSAAPWKPELRLDESTSGALVLELWLQAEDDTTLSLPAARLWDGGAEIFAFVRASDAPRDLIRQLDALEPVLAEAGIEFDAAEPAVAELGADEVRSFLRNVLPRLEERGVPVLLPAAWMRAPRRLRVNLHATSPEPGMRSSGLLSPAALATFDWRLAIGDVTLTEEELDELATADESFVQVGGRWQAVRRSEIERALRFLEQRRTGEGIVDLVRAVSGLETDEAGLELGEVTLDAPRAGQTHRRRARGRRARQRRGRHVLRRRHARRRRARRRGVGPAAARRGAGRQEPGDKARTGAAPAAGAAARGDDRDADREPPERAVGDHERRQSRAARLAGVVRPHVRAADRDLRRRAGAAASADDRGALRPPPRQGVARDRARASG